MLSENLFTLMSTAEAPTSMDFVLNLEVLNQCAHHCPGCFVNRRNSIDDIDLKQSLHLVHEMDYRGLFIREIVISPTDLFSADNAVELLTNPDMQKILQVNPRTRITSTAMFDNVNWDKFTAVFDVLDNPDYYREDMILEFFVPLDAEKLLSRDEKYFSDFHRVMEFFRTQTKKEIDWSFVINVHHDQLLFDNFNEISKIVKDEFNTIIEFLPSFFRNGNGDRIKQHLQIWKDFLNRSITPDTTGTITASFADSQFNSYNAIVVNYKRGQLYVSPFMYEQIVFPYEQLRIEKATSDGVFEKVASLQLAQYEYAKNTSECSDCLYLSNCVGRNVLSLMECNGITECIQPKKALDVYNNAHPATECVA